MKFNRSNIIQPILTVVLIALLGFLVYRFGFSKNQNGSDGTTLRQVNRKVSLDQAISKYLDNSYEIYTRGVLFVKNAQDTNGVNPEKATVTPSAQVAVTQNEYNYFFYTDKGTIHRLDYKNLGKNESLFKDSKGNLVFVDNVSKSYTVYPLPDESETKVVEFFKGTDQVLQETFPLTALIKDYKAKKFNPVEESTNTFVGKWQHQLFTSNEVVTVIIQTDPSNELFRKMRIVHGFIQTPSDLSFDFIKTDNVKELNIIPAGYTEIALKSDYKKKQN
jgi:hypothetical protein